ncbi:MAG: NADH-quinone oxidoreductase subunit NuoK [Deltaproteobacteria bacterium HGW-Deltaproteobacteria-14]|nr:MAG: NADH-quinone oxidoreductase subunit NuoK [Deltaproteobacteria bacterium HGW-Deltaproteobacteria-14]
MNLESFVLLSLVLFTLGLYAVMARRNLIAILIGIELMLNAASLNFMAFNRFLPVEDPTVGQLFVLFIIGLAAAEVAIALSIILVVYRERKRIDVDDITELKG